MVPGYTCETTATGRRQPTHIHSDVFFFFPYKYFVPGWTQIRTEKVRNDITTLAFYDRHWAILIGDPVDVTTLLLGKGM